MQTVAWKVSAGIFIGSLMLRLNRSHTLSSTIHDNFE